MAEADDRLRKALDHRDWPLVDELINDLVRENLHEQMRARIAKIPRLTRELETREWASFAIATALVSSRNAVRRT